MIRQYRVTSMIALGVLTLGGISTQPALASGQSVESVAGQILNGQTASPIGQVAGNGGAGGLLGNIFGCSSGGNKQIIGAAAGGAVGGLVGGRVAGGALGTVLGGVIGAAAGSALGCKLQRNDRNRAERATQAAMESGRSQDWQNPETGASGHVEVANSANTDLTGLRFASGVEPASNFSRIGKSYIASAAVNVRAAPVTSSPIVAKLMRGQRVWVPAGVTGKPWLLISDAGMAQGYVAASLLRPAPQAAANCRMVTQDVSLPGEAAQSESFQACKDRSGNWVMTRV